jgi:hypothetical protein
MSYTTFEDLGLRFEKFGKNREYFREQAMIRANLMTYTGGIERMIALRTAYDWATQQWLASAETGGKSWDASHPQEKG